MDGEQIRSIRQGLKEIPLESHSDRRRISVLAGAMRQGRKDVPLLNLFKTEIRNRSRRQKSDGLFFIVQTTRRTPGLLSATISSTHSIHTIDISALVPVRKRSKDKHVAAFSLQNSQQPSFNKTEKARGWSPRCGSSRLKARRKP